LLHMWHTRTNDLTLLPNFAKNSGSGLSPINNERSLSRCWPVWACDASDALQFAVRTSLNTCLTLWWVKFTHRCLWSCVAKEFGTKCLFPLLSVSSG
jgi:uncharacterized membrane protein YccC